jgi:ABC-type lipoprotein release transport system permease subunit
MTIFDKVVDDSKNIPVFLTESVIFGISGLLLGVLVDKQFKKLTKKYTHLKLVIALAQFIVLAVFIAIMYRFVRNEFALHFQQTLAGMTFPAMYFGVQSNLFDTAQSLF